MRLSKLSAAAAAVSVVLSIGIVPIASANSVVGSTSTSVTLTYRLVDLDANDGITPWINFSDTSQVALAYGTQESNFSVITRAGGIFAGPDVTHGDPDGFYQAQYTANGHGTSARLSTDVFTPGATPEIGVGLAHFYGTGIDPDLGFAVPLDGDYAFQLSPNTALIVEATTVMSSSLDMSVLVGTAFHQSLIDNRQVATVSISSLLDFSFDVGADYVSPPDDWEFGSTSMGSELLPLASLGPDVVDEAIDVTQSDTTFATYYNGSASEVYGRFSYFLNSNFFTGLYELPPIDPEWPPVDEPVDPELPPITPAIPEPSTYALMLLGLAGVGAAARRQRRIVATH